MVHGLGGSWDDWRPVTRPLSRRRLCLVPDLPGFGRSPKPEAPYTVGWLAEVLRDLLRGSGALPAVLCGNSLGGHICLEYARRWPQDVLALVLSAPAGGPQSPSAINLALLNVVRCLGRGRLARRFGPTVLPWFIRRLFYRCGPECREKMAFYQHYLHSPEYPLFLRAGVRAAASHLRGSLLPRLGGIDVPALVIAGRHDPVIPLAEVRGLSRGLPHSELVVFEACGHLPQVEQPERFVAEVERFLKGL
jgi:pimeloyl-ACP methyl ester carboxylesterase